MNNETLHHLLVGAFEGGINYWANSWSINKSHNSYEIPNHIKNKYKDFVFFNHDGSANPSYAYLPLITDDKFGMEFIDRDGDMGQEGKRFFLNKKAIKKGYQVLKEKYPAHAEDIKEENWDANTSDALIQCSLFGELVYG